MRDPATGGRGARGRDPEGLTEPEFGEWSQGLNLGGRKSQGKAVKVAGGRGTDDTFPSEGFKAVSARKKSEKVPREVPKD